MYKYLLFGFLSILIFSTRVSGAREKVTGKLSGAGIFEGARLSVYDNKYPSPAGDCLLKGSEARIMLAYDHSSDVSFPESGTYSVLVNVTAYDRYGKSSSYSKTLLIKNDRGIITDKDVLIIKDVYAVQINVSSPVTVSEVYLEASIETERYYNMDISSIPYATGITGKLSTDHPGFIEFYWDYFPGAEEYDLEYTWVEKSTEVVDLRNNSTRITLKDQNYLMPDVFDGGFIIYRIRPVGSDGKNRIPGKWSSEGASAPKLITISSQKNKTYQTVSSFIEDGKRKDVITFYDGSLRNRQIVTRTNSNNKTVVGETIYDYEGRPAVNILPVPMESNETSQDLTYKKDFNKYSPDKFDLDNSACNNGPDPLKPEDSKASHYFSSANTDKDKGFNRNLPDAGQYPFSQTEFEPDNTGRIRRQSGVGADHKLGSGHESKYYYGLPEKEQLQRLFGSNFGDISRYKRNMVIDANGQISVSYLNEADKVIATALAGEAPFEGTGESFKKILEELDSSPPVKISSSTPIDDYKSGEKVSGLNTVTNQNTLLFAKPVTVSTSGEYTIDYQFSPEFYSQICSSKDVCYECVYKLKVSLKNSCGEDMLIPREFNIGSVPEDEVKYKNLCNSNIFKLDPIKVPLQVGSYSLVKELIVSESALEQYIDDKVLNCGRSKNDFIKEALAKVDGEACEEITCQSCLESLNYNGDIEQGYQNYINSNNVASETSKIESVAQLTIEEYEAAVNECKDICEANNNCYNSYLMMLSDVSPGGQYGATDPSSEHWSLSVYNPASKLPRDRYKNRISLEDRTNTDNTSYYRYPVGQVYTDENGKDAFVPVYPVNDDLTDFDPEVSDVTKVRRLKLLENGSFITVDSDKDFDLYGVSPQYLLNLEDFVSEFDPEWAKSLVMYHPEYIYYEFCEKNSVKDPVLNLSSEEFDAQLFSYETKGQAVSAEMFGPITSYKDILDKDPYFKNIIPNTLTTRQLWLEKQSEIIKMQYKLQKYSKYNNKYLNIKEFVAFSTRCPGFYYLDPESADNAALVSECTAFGQRPAGATGKVTNEELELLNTEWEMYRNFYLGEKQKIQTKSAHKYAQKKNVAYKGFNGCIGEEEFNPFSTDFAIRELHENSIYKWVWGFKENLTANSPVTQPCSFKNYKEYKNKEKRFIEDSDVLKKMDGCELDDPDRIMSELAERGDIEIFQQTGQCPMEFHLEQLFDKQAQKNRLFKNVQYPLYNNPAFTKKLYDYLTEGKRSGFLFQKFYLKPTDVTPEKANYKIVALKPDGSENTNYFIDNDIDFEFATPRVFKYEYSQNGYTYTFDIPINFNTGVVTVPAIATDPQAPAIPSRQFRYQFTGIRRFMKKGKNEAERYLFTADASLDFYEVFSVFDNLIATIEDLAIKGSTNIQLDYGCPSDKFCKISQESKDVVNFLSAVASDKLWQSEPKIQIYKEDKEDPLSGLLFTPALRKYFNESTDASGTAYNFSVNQNTLPLTLSVKNSSGSNQLVLTLENSDPLSLEKDLNKIISFTCVKPSLDNNDIKVVAVYDKTIDDENPEMGYVDLICKMVTTGKGTFKSKECELTESLYCNDIYVKNKENLNKFLNSMVFDGSTSTENLSLKVDANIDISNNEFLYNLEQTSSNYIWKNVTITGNKLEGHICHDEEGTEKCNKITLEATNAETDFSFVKIQEFFYLQPDYSTVKDFYPNGFTVVGMYESGSFLKTVLFKGSANYPISSCERLCEKGKTNLLSNSHFLNPTIPTAENNFAGWNSDFEISIPTSNISLQPGQQRLTKDAFKTGNSGWRGIDPTFTDGYFLAVDGDDKKRAWYTKVNVVQGKSYRFSTKGKNLWWASGDEKKPVIVLYQGNILNTSGVPDINSHSANKITKHQLKNPDTYSESYIWNGSEYVQEVFRTPWDLIEGYFTPDFTGEVEIGILCVDEYVQDGTPFSTGNDFGLDDIMFEEVCEKQNPEFPINVEPDLYTCNDRQIDLAIAEGELNYETYYKGLKDQFKREYLAKCLSAKEKLSYSYPDKEHHYTLYYYDQAGNLVKTVPPKGVEVLDMVNDKSRFDAFDNDLKNGTFSSWAQPQHTLATTYNYNSLNQLVSQSLPDHEPMDTWEAISANPVPAGYTVNSTAFINANAGFMLANGANGISKVLVTEDGSANWTETNTSIGLKDIKDIQYVSAVKAFAISKDGSLLISEDGGNNWTIVPFGAAEILHRFHFTSSENGLIYDVKGGIYTTTDGVTWKKSENKIPLIGELTDVSINGSLANASSSDGNRGYLYKSVDGGNTWISIEGIKLPEIKNLEGGEAGAAVAAGVNGLILESADGGSNWGILSTSLSENIIKIHRFGSQKVILTASGKIKYLGSDKKTWKPSGGIYGSETFVDFIFYNDFTGYARTSDNVLYYTDNGGFSWRISGSVSYSGFPKLRNYKGQNFVISPSGTGSVLTEGYNTVVTFTKPVKDIWFTSDNRSIVLFNDGTISLSQTSMPVLSNNGWSGIVWTSVEGISGINEGHFYSSDKAYLVDSDSKIYKFVYDPTLQTALSTEYLTINYNSETIIGYSYLNFSSENQGIILTSDGKILATGDAGVTWSSKTAQSSVLNTVHVFAGTDEVEARAAGANGISLVKMRSDSHWTVENKFTIEDINEMTFKSSSSGIAVGNNGTIFRKTTSGWEAPVTKPTGTTNQYCAVALSSVSDLGIISGNNGKVLKTTDGGINWTEVNSGTSIYTSVAIADEGSNILVAGENGKILKSSDNGSTWTTKPEVHAMSLNMSFSVKETVTGYSVGKGGVIVRTDDKGETWKTLNSGVRNDLYGIYFKNPEEGIVTGKDLILTTKDGGNTWSKTLTFTGILRDVHGVYDYLLAVGDGGKIYKSDNGGTTWSDISSGSITADLRSVYMINTVSGFAVGNAGTIVKFSRGTSGALSLTLVPAVGTRYTDENLNDITFVTTETGYIVGANGTILKTTNAGKGWSIRPMPSFGDKTFTGVTFRDNSNGVISLSDGSILNIRDEVNERSSRFWYDKVGRLAVSQNSAQYDKTPKAYSYTIFDALGRITEVGEIEASNEPTSELINAANFPSNWGANRREISRTYYDKPLRSIEGFSQDNLRSRVSSASYSEKYNEDGSYNHATHYSYDIHGSVKTIIQENNELKELQQDIKRIDYLYDLVSGKVNEVHYQKGQPDQFFHKYEYDADNRITEVYTSADYVSWDKDARYFFYDHGPLARVELGEHKVQGLDYAYTMQGWLKGVNSNTLVTGRDIGKDGVDRLTWMFPKDELGYTLGYYTGDYKSIGTTSFMAGTKLPDGTESELRNSRASAYSNNLYNGNISHMVTAIGKLMEGANASPQAMTYRYDQLNRLKSVRSFKDQNVVANNFWAGTGTSSFDYAEDYKYDANGNILSLSRNATGASDASGNMDRFEYKYEHSDFDYQKNTNKLKAVADGQSAYTGTGDVKPGQIWNPARPQDDNYQYDAIGNLVSDKKENIEKITWTVSGKVKSIKRFETENAGSDLEFFYDATGNRVAKLVKPRVHGILLPEKDWIYTSYVKDASGNVMAIYDRKYTDLGDNNFKETISLTEQDIYGTSRMGLRRFTTPLKIAEKSFVSTSYSIDKSFSEKVYSGTLSMFTASTTSAQNMVGLKVYELANHLGNVLVTVSDKKSIVPGTVLYNNNFNDGTVQGWQSTTGTAVNNSSNLKLTNSTTSVSGYRNYTLESGMAYSGSVNLDAACTGNVTITVTSGSDKIYEIKTQDRGNIGFSFKPTTTTVKVEILQTVSVGSANLIFDDVKISKSASYLANVLSAQDYYPFGMQMPGRVFNNDIYRYGFQGQEKDNEVKGDGNSINYSFRIHDPRIGRFLSIDPLTSKYPYWTPYQFSGNRVIDAVELEGLEPASTEEREQALNKIADFSYDETTTSVWTNIPKSDFVNSLYTIVENQTLVNQQRTNLCGVATPVNIAIEYDPMSFVNMAINIYVNGETPSNHFFYSDIKANPDLLNSSPTRGLSAAEYVIFSSIKHSGNLRMPYDPVSDAEGSMPGFAGFTMPQDVSHLLTNFHNIENKSASVGLQNLNADRIERINFALSKNYAVAALLDWNHFTTGTPSSDKLQSTFGSHYIRIKNLTLEGDNVRVDFWSWGADQPSRVVTQKIFNESLKMFQAFY